MNIVSADVVRATFVNNRSAYTFQAACESAIAKIAAAAQLGQREEAEVSTDHDFFMMNKCLCAEILKKIEAAGWTVRTTDVDGINMVITFSFEI